MFALLLILVFGSTSNINEKPMHLGVGEHQFRLTKPIWAVNSRAHLEIDVSTMLRNLGQQPGTSLEDFVEKRFPRNCLKATLHGPGDVSVRLEFSGHAWGTNHVVLIVGKPGSVQTWQKFDLLRLSSCTPLDSVTLRWKNAEL